MLKRYIVFTPTNHAPNGGWYDVLIDSGGNANSFDTIEGAVAAARPALKNMSVVRGHGTYHIVDLHTGKVVQKGNR
ncbi:MAG: hypothetical protein A3H76_03995 [Candidatus Lloydbacteria bacterium RIFCSPLOWO2_02_FULL_54_12]|nr:MAG: hypothetical protein A2948_04540 [Candidatus Lloydbacteria bacterium RIFCSPLOWO2_01_FULL_54_18]OGZ15597.1 MAG: hypothetical protein A3H76_03995 [Candidatus Lloydbacteria bacterium RIFCSPLOWO2_02_FULL_54_12]